MAWLKWAFDFGDVIKFAKQLDANVRQLPGLVRPLLDEFEPKVHGFFVAQEETVHEVFTNLKEQVLPNRTVGSNQTPLAGVPAAANNPGGTRAADQAQGPHASWLTDKLTGPTGTNPAAGAAVLVLEEDLKARVDGLADDFMKILTSSAAGSHLEAALEDFGKLFTNLFRAEDAQAAVAMELTTLFDLLEQLVEAGLVFLDNATHQAMEWLRTALDTFIELLDTPVTGLPLIDVLWDYLVSDAGLTAADFPLTWGHLMAVFLTFPTTVICKMITGRAPVTDHPTAGMAGPIDEIFLGISELVEIPLRQLALVVFFGSPPPRGRPSWPSCSCAPTGRSPSSLSCTGSGPPPATRASVAAYVSWVLDLVWNVADFAVFMSQNTCLEAYYRHRNVYGTARFGGTMPPTLASSAYGLAQCVLAAITWWPDNINYYTSVRLSRAASADGCRRPRPTSSSGFWTLRRRCAPAGSRLSTSRS